MVHFEAAVATTAEAVPLGEHFQEARADSPILDRRVVEKVDPDGRTGAVLGHRQEWRAEVARICTGVLRPVVELEVGAHVCRGRPHFSTFLKMQQGGEGRLVLLGTLRYSGICDSENRVSVRGTGQTLAYESCC